MRKTRLSLTLICLSYAAISHASLLQRQCFRKWHDTFRSTFKKSLVEMEKTFDFWGLHEGFEERPEILGTLEEFPKELRASILDHLDRLSQEKRIDFLNDLIRAVRKDEWLDEGVPEKVFRELMLKYPESATATRRALAEKPFEDTSLMTKINEGIKSLFNAESADAVRNTFFDNLKQLDTDAQGKLLNKMKTWPREQNKRAIALIANKQGNNVFPPGSKNTPELLTKLEDFYKTPTDILIFRDDMDRLVPLADDSRIYSAHAIKYALNIVTNEKAFASYPSDIAAALRFLQNSDRNEPGISQALLHHATSNAKAPVPNEIWRSELALLGRRHFPDHKIPLNNTLRELEEFGESSATTALEGLVRLSQKRPLSEIEANNAQFKKIANTLRQMSAKGHSVDAFLAAWLTMDARGLREPTLKFLDELKIRGPKIDIARKDLGR